MDLHKTICPITFPAKQGLGTLPHKVLEGMHGVVLSLTPSVLQRKIVIKNPSTITPGQALHPATTVHRLCPPGREKEQLKRQNA